MALKMPAARQLGWARCRRCLFVRFGLPTGRAMSGTRVPASRIGEFRSLRSADVSPASKLVQQIGLILQRHKARYERDRQWDQS